MKFEYSASAVVENSKGGKKSNVELQITLRDGGRHTHCWDMSGVISVNRNGNPFRVERTCKGLGKKEFIIYLSSEICRQIQQHYDGCNVDSTPITKFINEEVNKFIKNLNL